MSQLQLIGTDQALPLSALIDSARMAEQAGEWEASLDLYRSAIKRIHAGEDPQSGPQVLRWIGRVLFGRSDYEGAHGAFEASLVNAQALGRRKDAASALNGMAVVEQFRGRLDVAEALYERSCVMAKGRGQVPRSKRSSRATPRTRRPRRRPFICSVTSPRMMDVMTMPAPSSVALRPGTQRPRSRRAPVSGPRFSRS